MKRYQSPSHPAAAAWGHNYEMCVSDYYSSNENFDENASDEETDEQDDGVNSSSLAA